MTVFAVTAVLAVLAVLVVVLTASAVGADVLLLILLLRRVGIVGCLRLGLRVGVLSGRAITGRDVATGDVHRRVAVDSVLLADGEGTGPLLGVGLLDPDLRRTGTTTAELAGGAADVLLLVLLLRRVGVVGGLRLGLGVGGLIRRARARGDVATSDVDGHVRVHGVLVTHRERSGLLIGLRLLDSDLGRSGPATPDLAGRAAPDILGLVLLLGRVGVVGGLRLSFGVRRLVCRARPGGHAPAGDVDRHVRVDGVLLADRRRFRVLLGVGRLDADLRCTGAATADMAGAAVDVLGLCLLLGGVGVVGRLRLGLRVRQLIGGARARGDVPAGHVHRHVRVDRVLVAHGQGTCILVRVGKLRPDLGRTRTAAAG